jgi:hypothetical protein
MQVGQRQEFLAWPRECFIYIVNCIVFLQDDFLFVNFHSALEIDTVMEKTHEWLHIQFMFHLVARHAFHIRREIFCPT